MENAAADEEIFSMTLVTGMRFKLYQRRFRLNVRKNCLAIEVKYRKKLFGDTAISLTGVLKVGKTNFFQKWVHIYLM